MTLITPTRVRPRGEGFESSGNQNSPFGQYCLLVNIDSWSILPGSGPTDGGTLVTVTSWHQGEELREVTIKDVVTWQDESCESAVSRDRSY